MKDFSLRFSGSASLMEYLSLWQTKIWFATKCYLQSITVIDLKLHKAIVNNNVNNNLLFFYVVSQLIPSAWRRLLDIVISNKSQTDVSALIQITI